MTKINIRAITNNIAEHSYNFHVSRFVTEKGNLIFKKITTYQKSLSDVKNSQKKELAWVPNECWGHAFFYAILTSKMINILNAVKG